MRCKLIRPIFQNKENGYCVFLYQTEEEIPEGAETGREKNGNFRFGAVGNYLPENERLEVELYGKWVKGKYGLQYHVERYEEIRPQTKEGIRSYLASGMVKGIGPRTAEMIVERFGIRTFEVLEHYPESLLEIRGITRKKLENILASYQDGRALRDLAAYLAPFQITQGKIKKIYDLFGNDALEMVKRHPYQLCQIKGFGFLTADAIARASQRSLDDPMRIEACAKYCMELVMQEGNLYQNKEIFKDMVYGWLNHGQKGEVVSKKQVAAVLNWLVGQKELRQEGDIYYPEKMFEYEYQAAKKLTALLEETQMKATDVAAALEEAEQELSIHLSARQKEAVIKAFACPVSIITGGPGTGKTTIQRVLLYLNDKTEKRTVLLTAPTGRASRRMAESTGYSESSTMHSALGLGMEESEDATSDFLDAGFILADEFSMVDMRLAFEFFSRIRPGTRLILIGDVNQLPSVGPGSVFRELIGSGVIPVTVLDLVYRQKEGGRIAENARKIRENQINLDYGEGFWLRTAESDKEAAEAAKEIFQKVVGHYGQENVQVLTPYRKNGEVSVNALNPILRELANPAGKGKKEIRAGRSLYRVGDRVLQNRNKNEISNGDIGYITDILFDEDDGYHVRISFSDNRVVEYGTEDMDLIEHAYATTVHKSQGSEYAAVILLWMPSFYKMLRRDILYTAVTRAKEQVWIVGHREAVATGIRNTESDRRNTRLGERIQKEYEEKFAA